MKVIIFGATGTIGRPTIEQALELGYQVTAFSRNAKSLQNDFPLIDCINGDVTNSEDVQNATKEHNAVIVVLGSGKNRKGTVRSEGTNNIIQSMQSLGIARLICQTTLGCGDSKGNLNFFWKRIMFGWFLKEVFLDHERQEELVRNSQLDWTLVRPGAFIDGKRTGNYKSGFGINEKGLKLKISRADVADFILKQLKTNQFMLKAAALSY